MCDNLNLLWLGKIILICKYVIWFDSPKHVTLENIFQNKIMINVCTHSSVQGVSKKWLHHMTFSIKWNFKSEHVFQNHIKPKEYKKYISNKFSKHWKQDFFNIALIMIQWPQNIFGQVFESHPNSWLSKEHQRKQASVKMRVFLCTCVCVIEECVLTGMVWLPCRALIADWASACVENFTKAQPEKKRHTQRYTNTLATA